MIGLFVLALCKTFITVPDPSAPIKCDSAAITYQVLVIFSDGLDEDVMKLEWESELLRQSGKNKENVNNCYSQICCTALSAHVVSIVFSH